MADVINVTEGVTSIEVTRDEIPQLIVNGYVRTTPQERLSERRPATGARKAALASFENPYPSCGTPSQFVSIFPFMFSRLR